MLLPAVLRAYVAEVRLRHTGHAGRRYRTWAGCFHAVVQRSRVPLASTRRFVAEWLAVHVFILNQLDELLAAEPHCTYFA